MQMGVKRLIVVSTPQRTRKSARPVVICEDQASIHLKNNQKEKRIIKTMRNRNRKKNTLSLPLTKWTAAALLRFRLVSLDSS